MKSIAVHVALQRFRFIFLPRFQYAVFAAVSITILALVLGHVSELGSIDLYTLYSAGREFLTGANPYTQPELYFYTPIWSMIVLAPLSLLPFTLAGVIWTFLAFAVWIAVLRVCRVSVLDSALFMLNPFFIHGMALGSYDWLVLLGLFLPMNIGIWLLMLKPQATVGILFYHIQRVGIVQAVKDYWLAGLVFISTLLMGFYRADILTVNWNWSLGWVGVPVGLYLVWQSFKRQDSLYAIAAAPFFSPYVAIQTWALPCLLLTRKRWALLAGIVLSWLLVLYR